VINKLYILTFMVVLVLTALAQAQTFTDLYNFTYSSGAYPSAAVIEDSSGNLYGTASGGGTDYFGVVYEFSSSGTYTVLYAFTGSPDGESPNTPVIRDSQGNLYGTAGLGGTDSCGVVFKLDTAGTETVLHSFAGTPDGCNPYQGVIMDKKGNLYGTTSSGGTYREGTVFKLTAKGRETLLHRFQGEPSDGAYPSVGHLIMDEAGNLYGLTDEGGTSSDGVLYKLTPKGKETLLYSFAGGSSDGCQPFGTVAMDKTGNFYGTTEHCGSNSYGTIWKVSAKGKETILHNFAGGTSDGCYPVAGVTLDSKGNLYGNTDECGGTGCDGYGCGTVWELSAKGRLTLLHSFDGSDGVLPNGEVLRTTNGTLFGTTPEGGTGCDDGCGTVWSYVP
jgi:uncharacterized repeat protein (TIGR03803 family)